MHRGPALLSSEWRMVFTNAKMALQAALKASLLSAAAHRGKEIADR